MRMLLGPIHILGWACHLLLQAQDNAQELMLASGACPSQRSRADCHVLQSDGQAFSQ